MHSLFLFRFPRSAYVHSRASLTKGRHMYALSSRRPPPHKGVVRVRIIYLRCLHKNC